MQSDQKGLKTQLWRKGKNLNMYWICSEGIKTLQNVLKQFIEKTNSNKRFVMYGNDIWHLNHLPFAVTADGTNILFCSPSV